MTESEEKEQFINILEEHIGIVIKISRIYAYSRQDREDLIHDIIFELWKSFRRFNGGCKISTWIYRVTLNISMNYMRGKKNAILFTSFNDFKDKEISLWIEKEDNSPQLELLYHCIEELNEIDKAIILLYLDRKSHDEISEIMGISKTNVGTRMSRIKEHLRKLVNLKNE